MAGGSRLLAEVVRTVDLQPIPLEGDSLRLRLEVLRELSSGLYVGRLWRFENFRLDAPFQGKIVKSDVTTLIEEIGIDISDIKEKEADLLVTAVLERIGQRFGN